MQNMIINELSNLSSDHEIFYSANSDKSLLLSDNEIKIKQSSESSGYGIRVLHNGNIGFSYCQNEKLLKQTAEQAKKTAKFFVTSKFSFQKKSSYPKLDIHDKKVEELDETELREMLYEIKTGMDKHAKKSRISINSGELEVAIANSNGLYANYKKTNMSVYAEAMLGKGYGFSYQQSMGLPKNLLKLGEDAGKMAKDMQYPKKVANGRYNVVFSADALHSLLGILLPSLSGDWKRRKISKLAEHTGKKIFDEKFSLYDDATIPASDSSPCDDEGTVSKRIALIENGVVKNFLYDLETSYLEGVKAEGACNRSDYSTVPSIGNKNIYIPPGNYGNFDDELKEFLLIKSMHGTHTSNLTTGDFGVEVNVGWHFKNKKTIPVRGFLIADNIFNVFNKIEGIEKQTTTYDNMIAPRIAFKEIQVVS